MPKVGLLEKFIEAVQSNSNAVHIVPSLDGWTVKKEGSKRAHAVKASEEEAIKYAKETLTGDKIILHHQDGSVQQEW
ncbi:MAG: DUF2188 domain-containing protein [Saprospiraceae bacterium]|jgi:hypothetical protein